MDRHCPFPINLTPLLAVIGTVSSERLINPIKQTAKASRNFRPTADEQIHGLAAVIRAWTTLNNADPHGIAGT